VQDHSQLMNPIPSGNNRGDRAFAFTIRTTDGKTVSLSDYKGKPVVIEFIATWCPYCRNDLSVVKDVYPKYSDDVGYLLIGMDLNEDADKLSAFVHEHGPFDVGLGTETILSEYGIVYTTTKFAVNGDGIIEYKGSGQFTARQWETLFTALI
jgi:cytochrome c biogenesis protein CcmG, thiol:disulfide interchange protein DsbE